ncbi:hypothetical protein [Haloglycomyces albus]|uniref:hypothetical protein n=1 Tax=Haloglycomyces albus TaxID=526067 RepID=UPI00046D420E|nr:hypothetical protein [Haloglycomyces albus]
MTIDVQTLIARVDTWQNIMWALGRAVALGTRSDATTNQRQAHADLDLEADRAWKAFNDPLIAKLDAAGAAEEDVKTLIDLIWSTGQERYLAGMFAAKSGDLNAAREYETTTADAGRPLWVATLEALIDTNNTEAK